MKLVHQTCRERFVPTDDIGIPLYLAGAGKALLGDAIGSDHRKISSVGLAHMATSTGTRRLALLLDLHNILGNNR